MRNGVTDWHLVANRRGVTSKHRGGDKSAPRGDTAMSPNRESERDPDRDSEALTREGANPDDAPVPISKIAKAVRKALAGPSSGAGMGHKPS